MEINLSSTTDLHSERPSSERLPKHDNSARPSQPTTPMLTGSTNGWTNNDGAKALNANDDAWKKTPAHGEELIRHAKEMLTQELVEVFMKDIKTRIVSPSIYDFLNPKMRAAKSQEVKVSERADIKVKVEDPSEGITKEIKPTNGHDIVNESRSEHISTNIKREPKGKDLLASIEGMTSLPSLSKLPRFKKRNQTGSIRSQQSNGRKHSWRRSPSRSRSRSRSRRRYSDSESDAEQYERGRRRSSYSRGSSSDSSRSRYDSSRERIDSRRSSFQKIPGGSKERGHRDNRKPQRSLPDSNEDEPYHSSSSTGRDHSSAVHSKESREHGHRSPKANKIKKQHRRLRDYLSDVDDQSDEHYDFLRKLTKHEKEESDSEHEDRGFIVDDDEMEDVSIDDIDTIKKSKKTIKKLNKSKTKRKGGGTSDEEEPDRKKTKSLGKKSRQRVQTDDDNRAMELDIEQNMAELFESESDYGEQKPIRPKLNKAARKKVTKPKKKQNGLKIEDEDALDVVSTKAEAIVPSVVKTDHQIVHESSADDSYDDDVDSGSESIATNEFSDFDMDGELKATESAFDNWHPLKQVHDAEDLMFMRLAMQGYQTFDNDAPSETTHVIQTTSKLI